MKCAVAVIVRMRGRSVRGSKRTTNHAGILGLRNDTVTAVLDRARTCAFVIGVPQIADGCGRRVLGEGTQCPPEEVSHLRVPMTIPDAPPWIRYSTRSGASSVNVDTIRFRGLDARRST